MTKTFLSVLIIGIFVSGFFAGIAVNTLLNQVRVVSMATVKAVGVAVYWDEACTVPVTQIQWGILEPNSTSTKTVYVKSVSNVPTTLTVYAEDWHPPECINYITLSAEPNNVILQPNQVQAVILSLHVAQNVTGITNFSFVIVFVGSG